jgi:hypothetical protein
MRVKLLTAGLLAVAGLLAGSASSQAGDVFRLAIPAGDNTPTMKLGEVGPDADTLDIFRGGFRGGFGGGFRGGFGGGFRGGFGGGFRGGFVGGGFRSFYGGYGYRPYWGGFYGYRPYYWGGYGYGYSGYPNYLYSGYYGGLCPIGGVSPGIATTTFSLQLSPAASVQGVPSGSAPYPAPSNPARPAPNDGTFEYDGGPRSPIPIPRGEPSTPRTDPAPVNPQPSVPLEGRPVSIPATVRPAPKYTYPAYGEQPRASTDSARQVKR